MALPPAASDRQLRHRRTIDVQIHSRGDALWEVDARLTDVRPDETVLASSVRLPGDPIHDLLLRLVVTESFDIVAAGSSMQRVPYPGHCERHGVAPNGDDADLDVYEQLVGLNLLSGFGRAVRERFGGTRGCTHLSELTQVLPTAVIQAFAGTVIDVREDGAGSEPPFQLDRCHALRRTGPTVRTFYPRWHRPRSDDTLD